MGEEKTGCLAFLAACSLVVKRLMRHFLIKIIAPKNILVKREETRISVRKT